jgi:hypothetical protein
MKPMSMWVILGMSLLLVLTTEAANLNNRSIIVNDPDFGTPPAVKNTIPIPSRTQVNNNSLTATVFIDGSGELFVANPAGIKTQPESQDVLGFGDLLPPVKGKPGVSQFKTLTEGEEVEFE